MDIQLFYMSWVWTTISLIVLLLHRECLANSNAKLLYAKLFNENGFNKLIRPVDNDSDTLTVHLGLKLAQLIDVDERNQIITTNVWVRQEWEVGYLRWDPKEFGGIESMLAPSGDLWLPDVVMFNNADGNYEVTLMTKATVYFDGRVVWEPPAVYKSSCTIDVEFFPMDFQTCFLKFGSWTYDGIQVDLHHLLQKYKNNSLTENHQRIRIIDKRGRHSSQHKDKSGGDHTSGTVIIDHGIDLENYYESVEWELLEVPAKRNEKRYPCCVEPYPDITFNITMRRKTLFYTVNLIIPCVAISFLTVLVFYLPSESGEKITLCISILLSLTVFFLLLAEIIPPTSLVVPLIGKYLLFTMILVTLSILVTVGVINVHFRDPSTHEMPNWVKRLFIQILPPLLCIRRPLLGNMDETKFRLGAKEEQTLKVFKNGREKKAPTSWTALARSLAFMSTAAEELDRLFQEGALDTNLTFTNAMAADKFHLSEVEIEVKKAIDGVKYIAHHLKQEDEAEDVKEDWKFVAMVLDRLLLWIFTLACIFGTLGTILQAPTLYDSRAPLSSTNYPMVSNVMYLA